MAGRPLRFSTDTEHQHRTEVRDAGLRVVQRGHSRLMLGIQPNLTAAQIAGILQRTSRPLPGADFAWAHDAGFGRIDPKAALEETLRTRQPAQRLDRT